MNVDQLGRQAGAELRRVTARDMPASRMLEELHRTDRRRRKSRLVLAVTGAVLVAVLGWRTVASLEGMSRLAPAGPTRSPTTSTSASGQADPCSASQGPGPLPTSGGVLDCLGHNTYQAHIDNPVSFTLPSGWTFKFYGQSDADFYSATSGYGVSVVEDIAPAGMGSGVSAESVARWLAGRPFLVGGPVTQASLLGRNAGTVPRRLPAWQVDVHLKPQEAATGHCLVDGSQVVAGVETGQQAPCVPLMLTSETGFRSQGMWGTERIRWIFFDLPNGKPGAVFIWDFTNRPDMITAARSLMDSIVFS